MAEKTKTQQILEAGWDEDANGKRWEDYETIVCPDGQVIDMVQLLDDQHRAIAALVHLAPQFGGFLGKMRFIYTFHVKTQATDGYNIFVNPQFTANMDFTGKCFVMAHEVMHCLLNHLRRTKERDHEKANIAGDYECNVTLVQIGLFKEATVKKLRGYINMKYKDWGFEKIYDDCESSAGDTMGNDEGNKAKQNSDQSQNGNDGQGESDDAAGSGSNGGGQPNYSEKFKAGWAKAIADYNAGLIKL